MNINIEKIIARTIAGEATASERAKLQQWVDSSQTNKESFHKIMLASQIIATKNDGDLKASEFKRLSSRIRFANESKRRQPENNRFWLSAAAVIIILITSFVVFKILENTGADSVVAESVTVLKANPAGQKSKIFLPDGSIVWLNSESELSYKENFNDSIRSLYLKGEAYFEVIKDHARPFIVHTGNVLTTAIGTSFNIEAFNHDMVTVSLTSGIVQVETRNNYGATEMIQLTPGQGASYIAGLGNDLKLISIDKEDVKQWKDGVLILKSASLDHTLKTLERWYGVRFTVRNDAKRSWNANAVFDNEYLENVLNSLSFSQGFSYEINDKNVLITLN